MMDIIFGVSIAISAWRCSVLYQGKNDRQKAMAAVMFFEAAREAGVILQGLELRLGERVVIADLGAAQRAGDPEVGEELGGTLAGHRRAAVANAGSST